jgi:hypothetical protein
VPVTQGQAALSNIKALVVIPPLTWVDTLVWSYGDADRDADDLNGITNFTLYWGPSPSVYTNHVLTGRALMTEFVSQLTPDGSDYAGQNYIALTALSTNGLESIRGNEIRIPAAPLTNWVDHIISTGTNIAWSATLSGRRTLIGTNDYWSTNVVLSGFYWGVGSKSNWVWATQTRY